MNEHTTLEKIAPTVEEAVAEGLAELNLPAEAVDVEVLDNGSRGLFGVGIRQVRVRLSIKQTSHAGSKATEPASELVSNREEDSLRICRQTVVDLLEKMKIPATVDAGYGEMDEEGKRPVRVDIRGDNLSVLIGRRAEILNALQYIVNLIVSKQLETWMQVIVDVEGYRVRRERQLYQMAERLADQALKTGRRQVLEPMPASERRIIHIALRNHTDVTTQSIGEEPTRKVTICPK